MLAAMLDVAWAVAGSVDAGSDSSVSVWGIRDSRARVSAAGGDSAGGDSAGGDSAGGAVVGEVGSACAKSDGSGSACVLETAVADSSGLCSGTFWTKGSGVLGESSKSPRLETGNGLKVVSNS
jgi:hypothetical protein